MSAQTLLSGGDKYYSYSGEIFGDVSAPATISMILIPNTGLRDSYVNIQPFFGRTVSTGTTATGLGIQIKLDDVTVYRQGPEDGANAVHEQGMRVQNLISLFIPRQSKLEVISLNTADNNTQIRGANLIGYYL
jgi:hypothetical protein